MQSEPATDVVPLFPLPNVVLFPRAVLPLHVFEDRYRRMTADALCGDRRLAMALLRPGWHASYHATAAGRPALEPVVCVGTIVAHERLADGRYNLLLRGDARAKIVREVGAGPYRSAEVEPVAEPSVLELDVAEERHRLRQLFRPGGRLAALPVCGKFHELLGTVVPTSDAADLIAFHLLEDVAVKQQLLAEPDPRQRVRRVLAILTSQNRLVGPTCSDGRVDVNLN
jgi:Lon protease-like protein